MGIGLKGNLSWADVVVENRKRTRCKCEEIGRGKFCTFHGWSRTAPGRTNDNIKSTKQGDAIIKSRMIPRDEKGKPVVHTKRGARRKERLGTA